MAERTFVLPDLGEGLTEAQLVRWRVEPGARVEVNAPLCEVETAKAVVVTPSPWAGTVRTVHGRPGESIPVGAPLVTIAAMDEAGAQPEGEAVLVGYGSRTPGPAEVRRRPRPSARPSASTEEGVRAAPFVRQLARELGVDLTAVAGSGPDGRITRADVEAASRPDEPPGAALPVPQADHDDDQRISVVGIRKAIARQMVRSVSTIPQFTEFAVFDATALMAARERQKAAGHSMTPLPYFIEAMVKAVRAYPMLNSSWDDSRDEIIVKPPINIGIAVNTTQGLLVPVLRNAHELDLDAIARESPRLIEGARAGSLGPGDMSAGTITVTNVGASGPVETGTPVIRPPECCVVAFGAIKPRPMVVAGEVVARPGAWISISVDHRIVDGALATEFLTALVTELEKVSA